MAFDSIAEIKKHEFTYKGEHHPINHLFYPKKGSEYLLVVLSGFNGKEAQGVPGRYNYMRTLQDIEISKLFIKDSVETVPVYYMGIDGTDSYLKDTCNLIEEKLKELNVDKEQLIVAGSSKGGTGALIIGKQIGAGHIIAGANQVFVGSYISTVNNAVKDKIFNKILPSTNYGAVEFVNDMFTSRILIDTCNSKLYFHAGNKDSHYEKHMKPMLRHYDKYGILYELDLRNYAGHDTVVNYFPDYFKRKVNEIINMPFIKRPFVEDDDGYTKINLDIANLENAYLDWAIYIYQKDNKVKKIMYNNNLEYRLEVKKVNIKSVKVFLRSRKSLVEVKNYLI